jgi:hypothetical protein
MALFGYTFTTPELLAMSVGAAWLCSALSYAMPAPLPNSGMFYQFLYRLVHFAAANLDRVKSGKP